MRVIDGEVWRPVTSWSCPSCSRSATVLEGERVTGRMCAGDPTTGRTHPAVDMVRDVERRPDVPTGVLEVRRVLTREESDRLLELVRDPEYLAQLPCPCGMVEVDNPVRREVRHRRGCPRAGGA